MRRRHYWLLLLLLVGLGSTAERRSRHAPEPDCRAIPAPNAPRALANDNRVSAGSLENGVLTVRLVAQPAAWHPEGENGCGIRVHAFAEEGNQRRSRDR